MKIHHLNCGSMCPVGGILFDGFSKTLGSSLLSCHCLLIETDAHGLVLVDTGFGSRDIESPRPRLSKFFLATCRPRVSPDNIALAHVERLGFSAKDVRHIVLTHLDFDHAGGIDDFPEATIHVMKAEHDAAIRRDGWIARGRYRPLQFRDHNLWQNYETSGERWFGFNAVRQLQGLPPEILLVPLIGHTPGHAGVAIRQDNSWLLHAGDAYFYRGEMDPARRKCTPGLRFYQTMMESDRAWRMRNQRRLRQLIQTHGSEVNVFSAHDYQEYKALRDPQDLIYRGSDEIDRAA